MSTHSEQGHAPYIFIIYEKQEEIPDTIVLYDWETRTEWAKSETVHFRDNLPGDLFLTADLVVDVLNGKVKKNNLKNVEEHEVRQHYFKIYEKQIVEAVKNFFHKHPDAWRSLVETARKVEEDLEKEVESEALVEIDENSKAGKA